MTTFPSVVALSQVVNPGQKWMTHPVEQTFDGYHGSGHVPGDDLAYL